MADERPRVDTPAYYRCGFENYPDSHEEFCGSCAKRCEQDANRFAGKWSMEYRFIIRAYLYPPEEDGADREEVSHDLHNG